MVVAARQSLDWLRRLIVVLTSRCNLRCAYCYQQRDRPGSMSWDVLRRALELLLGSRRQTLELWFTGGEPLLEEALIRRAVAYCEGRCTPEKRVRFGLLTNGVRLSEPAIDFMIAHDFSVQLSFDGTPRAQALRARGSFQLLDSLLGGLRERHPRWFAARLEVAITVTAANAATLAASVGYFVDKGVHGVNIGPPVTYDPDWSSETSETLRRQFDEICDTMLTEHQRSGRVPVVALRPADASPPRPQLGRWLCGLASGESLTVDVDGRVAGCEMLVESYQTFPPGLLPARVGALRLGSVGDSELPARLAVFPALVRRTRLFDGRSRKYSALGRCGRCCYRSECSYCPLAIGRVPGNTDPDRVPDILCGFNRIVADARARFRARAERCDRQLGSPEA